jgi:hypothetical protein
MPVFSTALTCRTKECSALIRKQTSENKVQAEPNWFRRFKDPHARTKISPAAQSLFRRNERSFGETKGISEKQM